MDEYAPIVAVLIIAVSSQFRQVLRIDRAARAFCINLAAIPREADRLSFELAQAADFDPPTEQLRSRVSNKISANIGLQALNFSNDGTIAARFTRAVALYWLFNAPRKNGIRPQFPMNTHSKSAYARIMQLNETTAARADARYEELMHAALAYFTSSHPTKQLEDALNRTIADVSNLVCSLIARYVLYCDVTGSGRRQRLSGMGFDATHPTPSFSLDKWAMTILAVVVLSAVMMVLMPGTRSIAAGQILTIAITFAISIGFAVWGAVLVAQRFLERRKEGDPAFPPVADLIVAAGIVAGLSVATRIAIPLIPALLEGGGSGFRGVITQLVERLPGIITPFIGTISLGLLCSYIGALNWSLLRVAAVGAVANGLAFMGAGLLVGSLLDQRVLDQFFLHPEDARAIIVINTGMVGAVIGAMVLAAFRTSERVRRYVVARAGARAQVANAQLYASPTEDLEAPVPIQSEKAADNLGGYSRSNAEELEGRYICFRPTFATPGVISAYLVVLRWDEDQSCLIFEEQERADSAHTQGGRVYIPDGKPFVGLVTVERGAIRLIMVSRPDKHEPARGLIMTLSNPAGMHFTPASAPIVLRRVTTETPKLGYIQPGDVDYEAYRKELETVMPAFGLFATPPGRASDPEGWFTKPPHDVRPIVMN